MIYIVYIIYMIYLSEVCKVGTDDAKKCRLLSTCRLRDLQELTVTGPLAPFDEGVSVVFRGPMNLHNIVWYQERNSSLAKASSWTPT